MAASEIPVGETPAQTSGRSSNILVPAAAVLLGSIFLFTYQKGFNLRMQIWGEFYWYVDYSHGFVRRGLMGTLAAPLRALLLPQGVDAYNAAIVLLYHLFAIAMFGTMIAMVVRRLPSLEPQLRPWAVLGMAVFVASPVVSIGAYNSGYVDVVMMGAALAGMLTALRGKYLLTAAIGFVPVLINEAAVFIWLPIWVLLLGRLHQGGRWRLDVVAACMAPMLAIGAIVLFEDRAAPARIINALHFSGELKETLIRMQYGQSVLGQVMRQIELVRDFWPNFLISAAITQGATLLTALLAIRLGSGARLRPFGYLGEWLPALGFAFAPFLLLVFSWDVSRMMAWTNFSAGMLLLMVVLLAARQKELEA